MMNNKINFSLSYQMCLLWKN